MATEFRGEAIEAEILSLTTSGGVLNLVIEHPMIHGHQPGQIYVDDHSSEPFATDASRFAAFCALAAAWLVKARESTGVDVVHLHDWHAACFLVLREFDPACQSLKDLRAVYTIHNLALQGVRPLRQHPSSLFEWFPDLVVDARVVDPRWRDCINLMRCGITLSDGVNTVSPSYAAEVQRPNDPVSGFHGGEGLEADLKSRAESGSLLGILNGCDAQQASRQRPGTLPGLLRMSHGTILRQMARARHVDSGLVIALERQRGLARRRQQTVVTSVGRLTGQKAGLLLEPVDGEPLLHRMLGAMDKRGVMVMLGSGDAAIEAFMIETAARFENFLFIPGFDEDLADAIYRSGQVFLMPSSFEPCGISQMLAMRSGQPCLVHHVGGLIDTVTDGVNGWAFAGATPADQAKDALRTFEHAFGMAAENSSAYRELRREAARRRFPWADAAAGYLGLYGLDSREASP